MKNTNIKLNEYTKKKNSYKNDHDINLCFIRKRFINHNLYLYDFFSNVKKEKNNVYKLFPEYIINERNFFDFKKNQNLKQVIESYYKRNIVYAEEIEKDNYFKLNNELNKEMNYFKQNEIQTYIQDIKNKKNNIENYYNDNIKKNKKFDIFIDKQNAINNILSSTFAGIVSRTVTAPLDRIKYIMQVTNSLSLNEIFKMIKQDGIVFGFFRGNGINIIKIIPELSIKMYSYEFLKMNLYHYYNKNNINNININNENVDIPFFLRFLIGSSSGIIATLFIYPLEIIKTRLIVSNKNNEHGIFKCFYNIYKNESWTNFYNGLSMHLYGVILFSGCNMSIYDYLKYIFFSFYKNYTHLNYCEKGIYHDKNKLVEINKKNDFENIKNLNKNEETKNNDFKNMNFLYKKDDNKKMINIKEEFIKNMYISNNNLNNNFINKTETSFNINQKPIFNCSYCDYRIKNINCLCFLFFGITSSFIAQIVSYPFLVLRTRMQTLNNEITTNYLKNENKKIKSCNFILYNIKKYGFKSLYRGIYVNLLKTIPATSITWFSYEFSMRKLQNL